MRNLKGIRNENMHVWSACRWEKSNVPLLTAHYMRERYANNTTERKKQIARATAYHRLEAGIIVKEPCRLCGSEEVEMHHPDYSKPNDVVWLCCTCHDELHVLERKVMAA